VKKSFRIPGWVKLCIIIYSLIGIGIFYFQESIIFQPTVVAADSSYGFKQAYQEKNIDLDADTRFNVIQFTVPDSLRKGVVLYFHGNKGNVKRYNRFVDNFIRHGYEVWMGDYPGFGKSTGKRSEAVLYEESLQLYKLARTQYQPDQIILYGKSLGSGIAAQLASVRDCKRLILETPYYSLTSLSRIYLWMFPLDLLMHYHIPTHDYLTKVTAPVSIFHGTADGVIPYFNAKRLKAQLKKGDEFITIEGGSHRDLNRFPLMQQKLDSLLSR
jgi:uncharacterized protein